MYKYGLIFAILLIGVFSWGFAEDSDNYEWRLYHVDQGQRIYLFKNGVQIGCYDYEFRYWRAYDYTTNSWGPSLRNAPFEVPPQKGIQNFGVVTEKLSGSRYIINGRETSYEDVVKVFSDQIPDDIKKFRMTVIGPQNKQDEVAKAWSSVEEEIKDKVNCWYCEANHWSLKDLVADKTVFVTDGNPVIYFQAYDGEVLHRQNDFKGPQDFTAIRKAIRNYNPSMDRDLRLPFLGPIF